MTGVGVREETAVGVRRDRVSQADATFCHERPTLAFLAEAEVLQESDGHRREAIVDLRERHVVRTEPRHLVRSGGGLGGRRLRQAPRLEDVLVPVAFADPQQPDRRLRKVVRRRSRRDHDRRSSVRPERAVERVERIRDDGGREHVFQRQRCAHLRSRMETRVLTGRDGDGGQLLGRRAELVHVSARCHRVRPGQRHAVRRVELRMHRGQHLLSGLERRHARARIVSGRDQHGVAHAGHDGRRRVVQRGQAGRATRIQGHAIPREDLQVLGEHLGVVQMDSTHVLHVIKPST